MSAPSELLVRRTWLEHYEEMKGKGAWLWSSPQAERKPSSRVRTLSARGPPGRPGQGESHPVLRETAHRLRK